MSAADLLQERISPLMSDTPSFKAHTAYVEYPLDEMRRRSADFVEQMRRRRTVRNFSDRPVPVDIIENCIAAAALAPSGANQQPWTFAVVSDPAMKERIHREAEKVEQAFYAKEATRPWVRALAHLGTDAHKPFLKIAPYLIVIFAQRHGYNAQGEKKKHYYVHESVGIATGMLITALHNAGLVSLTYTPAKMAFLNRLLSRPANEKPFMILVAGYPAEKTTVPDLDKKSLEQVAVFF